MKSRIGFALLMFVMLSMTTVLLADPRQWDSTGIAIRQGQHVHWNRTVAKDAQGSALAVWGDMRNGYMNLYAQLLDPSGAPVWAPNGVLVSGYFAQQRIPAAVAVNGGWVIAWTDCRSDPQWTANNQKRLDDGPGPLCGDVYAQKLDNQGNRLWPLNNYSGVPVDTANSGHDDVHLVDDGQGGAIAVWTEDNPSRLGNIYAQRITSTGTQAWTNSLDVVGAQQGYQYALTADGDGLGNMLLGWRDISNGYSDFCISVTKITADGLLPWGPTGVRVSDTDSYVDRPSLCSDGANGCYIAWESSGSSRDLFMQRLNSAGQPYWTLHGLSLCAAIGDQMAVCLSPSYAGGVQDGCLAVWEDTRVNNNVREIYAYKILPTGLSTWSIGGAHVVGDAGPGGEGMERTDPRVTSDLQGGLICTWRDPREIGSSSGTHIFASRFTADAAILWQAEGVPVSTTSWHQYSPAIVPSAAGYILVLWNDLDVANTSLRYQRLDIAGGIRQFGDAGIQVAGGCDGSVGHVKSLMLNSGRTALVWGDSRGSCYYYQIVNAQGQPERTTNGEALTALAPAGSYQPYPPPDLCTDGNGGFFVSFTDNRNNSQVPRIRVAHVNAAGSVVSDSLGTMVWDSPTANDQVECRIAYDGAGGCLVAWSQYDDRYVIDVWAMRMNPDLHPAWPQALRLTNTDDDDMLKGIVPSTDGSCIIVWVSGAYGEFDISAARIGHSGTALWNRRVCNAVDVQDQPDIAPDNQGGAYFAWQDGRIHGRYVIYGQHVNASGVDYWVSNGVPIIEGTGHRAYPRVAPDSHGNLFVGWEDYRNGSDFDLYLQKLSPQGGRLWPDSGKVLVSGIGDQDNLNLLVDEFDGVFATWLDGRIYPMTAYAAHLDPNGVPVSNPYWVPAHGGMVARTIGSSDQYSVTHDGVGGFLVTWVELRVGDSYNYDYYYELYAQRMYDGYGTDARIPVVTVPAKFALNQNYPNPFNPVTQISFDVPRAGDVKLQVFDILGRQVATLVEGKLAPGTHSAEFDASKLASGVYIYRLESTGFSQSRKMVVLK